MGVEEQRRTGTGKVRRVRWGRGLLMTVLTLLLVVLHQDWWNWKEWKPLAFDFVPVGLWYHAVFSVACAVLMWLFVTLLWPTELERLEDMPAKHDGEGH